VLVSGLPRSMINRDLQKKQKAEDRLMAQFGNETRGLESSSISTVDIKEYCDYEK